MSLDTTNTVEIPEEEAYKRLLRKVEAKYTSIATIGRGGLGVAQRLAYKLDIPVIVLQYSQELNNLSKETLFVDDIVCSGTTIGNIPRNVDVATLVYRKGALYKPTYYGIFYEGTEYIRFSWEVNNG